MIEILKTPAAGMSLEEYRLHNKKKLRELRSDLESGIADYRNAQIEILKRNSNDSELKAYLDWWTSLPDDRLRKMLEARCAKRMRILECSDDKLENHLLRERRNWELTRLRRDAKKFMPAEIAVTLAWFVYRDLFSLALKSPGPIGVELFFFANDESHDAGASISSWGIIGRREPNASAMGCELYRTYLAIIEPLIDWCLKHNVDPKPLIEIDSKTASIVDLFHNAQPSSSEDFNHTLRQEILKFQELRNNARLTLRHVQLKMGCENDVVDDTLDDEYEFRFPGPSGEQYTLTETLLLAGKTTPEDIRNGFLDHGFHINKPDASRYKTRLKGKVAVRDFKLGYTVDEISAYLGDSLGFDKSTAREVERLLKT